MTCSQKLFKASRGTFGKPLTEVYGPQSCHIIEIGHGQQQNNAAAGFSTAVHMPVPHRGALSPLPHQVVLVQRLGKL